MEAIAIIGCIAAVVSAYRDGGAIVDKIKQKRQARQAPPPTRLLEDSLARGPKAVEEAKENGIERFGTRYAAGDKIALDSLKDILIDLQGSLLKHLRQAQENDNMIDFTTLVDASDIGRIRTVTVLNELYMRVAEGNKITQAPFGDMGSFTNPQLAGQSAQSAPNVHSQDSSSPLLYPSNGSAFQQPSPLYTQMPEQQREPRTTPKPGFFDRFRRKSSTEESSPQTSGRRVSNIQSKRDATCQSGGNDKSLPLSPITSPQAAIDEDNPWATEGSKTVPVAREPTPDMSFSRATTVVPSIQPRPSTVSSTSSTANMRMLSPYELHGGFCKGAYKMQVHEKDAMKLRNQSVAKTGEGYYWACCSSKCAFEGPARPDGKNWAFDDTVRECYGIRYRWSFLAKAHLALSKVKSGRYDYGCVFCIYDGYECPVFHGIKDFMEHVGTHRGRSIAETMLQRIQCINDRTAAANEGFDVNLTPLEVEAQPMFDKHISQSAQPSLLSAAASDRVSWTTSDEAMADVDPWKDAT